MKTLTRDEIEQHPLYQNSNETIPPNIPTMGMKRLVKIPYRSMDDNHALILRALHTAQFPLTRKQICERIGRKKAPHLNNLIEQMVADGTLARFQQVRPNGVVMYTYTLAGR